MKETRKQRIKRYMKLSKKDLVFMLVASQDAFDELVKALWTPQKESYDHP